MQVQSRAAQVASISLQPKEVNQCGWTAIWTPLECAIPTGHAPIRFFDKLLPKLASLVSHVVISPMRPFEFNETTG